MFVLPPPIIPTPNPSTLLFSFLLVLLLLFFVVVVAGMGEEREEVGAGVPSSLLLFFYFSLEGMGEGEKKSGYFPPFFHSFILSHLIARSSLEERERKMTAAERVESADLWWCYDRSTAC